MIRKKIHRVKSQSKSRRHNASGGEKCRVEHYSILNEVAFPSWKFCVKQSYRRPKNYITLGKGEITLSPSEIQYIGKCFSDKYVKESFCSFPNSVLTQIIVPLCIYYNLSQKSVCDIFNILIAEFITIRSKLTTPWWSTNTYLPALRIFGRNLFRKDGPVYLNTHTQTCYKMQIDPLSVLSIGDSLDFYWHFTSRTTKIAEEIMQSGLHDAALKETLDRYLDFKRNKNRGIWNRSLLRDLCVQSNSRIHINEFRSRVGGKHRFRPLMLKIYPIVDIVEYDDLFRAMVATKCLSRYPNTRRFAERLFCDIEKVIEERKNTAD